MQLNVAEDQGGNEHHSDCDCQLELKMNTNFCACMAKAR